MHKILLILHIFGACIWVGGHLYLLICLLPDILKRRDVKALLAFEQSYEKLGMGALIVQVVTGILMARQILPWALWGVGGYVAHLIWLKLLWLGLTLCVAMHAQVRIIPNLSPKTLPIMAVHIGLIALFSVCFVLTGVAFRF